MYSLTTSSSSFHEPSLKPPSSSARLKGLPPEISQLPFILTILNLPSFKHRFTFELTPCTSTIIPESKWEAFYILELMALLGLLPTTWKKSDYVIGVSTNFSYSFLINKCAKKLVWKSVPELPSKYPRLHPAMEPWSLVHTLYWLGHHLTTLQQYQWSIWNTGYSYEKRAMYIWKTVLALNLMDIPNDPPVLLLPHSYILSFDQTLMESKKKKTPILEQHSTSSFSSSVTLPNWNNSNLQVIPIMVPTISIEALVSSSNVNESTSTSATSSTSSSSSSASSEPSLDIEEPSKEETTSSSYAPIWTTIYYVKKDPLLPPPISDSSFSLHSRSSSSSNLYFDKGASMVQEKLKSFSSSTTSFHSKKTNSTSSLFSVTSTLSLTCSEPFLGNDFRETVLS